MIEIVRRVVKHPRKGTEYAAVLMENDQQLTCICPFTPYEAQVEMAAAAFAALLVTKTGEEFIRNQIALLP